MAMLRAAIVVLFGIQVLCIENSKYDDMLRQVMDDDVVKRSIENQSEGSGENIPESNITPDTMTPVMILAIVVASIIALGTFLFLGSCAYYKLKESRNHGNFARVRGYDGDESALYMVDYDELSIQHGRLTMETNENTAETTSIQKP